MTFRSVLLPVALLIAACGGATPGPSAPANTSTTPAASNSATHSATPKDTSANKSGGALTWQANMTKDQQIAIMVQQVMPKMGKVFKEADPKHYADFSCKTCHGPDKKEPKDFLPHLTMKDGKITSFAEKPEVSKYMAEKIVPEMAAAMGLKPYDPQTHTGFGCGGCHAIDKK